MHWQLVLFVSKPDGRTEADAVQITYGFCAYMMLLYQVIHNCTKHYIKYGFCAYVMLLFQVKQDPPEAEICDSTCAA